MMSSGSGKRKAPSDNINSAICDFLIGKSYFLKINVVKGLVHIPCLKTFSIL